MKNQKMLIITDVLKAKTEKERIDGKASRQYAGTTFAEAIEGSDGKLYANPFRTGYRNIFQNHTPDGKDVRWKVSPDQLNALKQGNLAIPGEIVTKKVKEFPVLGPDGKQNKAKDGTPVTGNRYTAVVLAGESVERVFAAAGHEIVGDIESAPATAPALQLEA